MGQVGLGSIITSDTLPSLVYMYEIMCESSCASIWKYL